MTARLGWVAAAALFAGAAVALAAGWVVVAGLLVAGCMFLTGLHSRRSAGTELRRQVAVLAADNARLAGQVDRLLDELNVHYTRQRAGRWADDSWLLPDNGGGYVSPAALNDRTTPVPAVERGVSAAQTATPDFRP